MTHKIQTSLGTFFACALMLSAAFLGAAGARADETGQSVTVQTESGELTLSNLGTLNDIPPHVTAVIDALGYHMRGLAGAAYPYPVVFKSQSVAAGVPIGILPKDAYLTEIYMNRAEPLPNKGGVELAFLAKYQNPAGRRAEISFIVGYKIVRGLIEISHVVTKPQSVEPQEVTLLQKTGSSSATGN